VGGRLHPTESRQIRLWRLGRKPTSREGDLASTPSPKVRGDSARREDVAGKLAESNRVRGGGLPPLLTPPGPDMRRGLTYGRRPPEIRIPTLAQSFRPVTL